MDANYEPKYHRLERDHFWFQGLHGLLTQLAASEPKTARVLDIGCASGEMLKALSAAGFSDVTGIDISERAVGLCRERGFTQVQVMDAAHPDFTGAVFDVIIAANIIEHIEDDEEALAQWRRILKPGGTLVVLTSAFMFLWSEHDRVNHHFRRYGRAELLDKLAAAGFALQRVSYWNFFLLGPIVLARFLRKLLPSRAASAKDDLSLPPAWLNAVLTGLLRFENLLLRYINLPWGVTIFAVAERER